MARIRKVLIANRGEIALRVIRTCRDMGLSTVAIYSEADRSAPHVRAADQAFCVGPPPSRESYLVQERILDVAQRAGADAIHPGYGFLSENASFVRACEKAGIVFIGPPAAAMDAMGEKTRARQHMTRAGVPVVPGSTEPFKTLEEAKAFAVKIGFPVMLKAAGGGGGKGMRRVDKVDDFDSAWRGAKSEAMSSFGNDAVYLEKYLDRPHHVELQVFADSHGRCIHLNERECSAQRRHQKVIEETPSPILTPAMREAMGQVAVKAAKAVGYVGAGTIEFLVDSSRQFYFLEMNTRLQVEHPVTEWVTGIDLVSWQLRIAEGEKLPMESTPAPRGHAIEVRVYAEDPAKGFLPSPGKIAALRTPAGPNVRDDSGVYAGYTVPNFYDPMISKLSVWGATRKEAIARMQRALSEYVVKGITTNLRYLRGMRLGEVLSLRCSEIDRSGQALRLGDTKSGASVRPLGMAAAAVLDGVKRPTECPFAFPSPRGEGCYLGLRNAFRHIIALRPALKGITPHTLRHSFASTAADLGFSELTVGALIGHRTGTVTSRYVHQLDKVLVAAADRVASQIEAWMCGNPGAEVVKLAERENSASTPRAFPKVQDSGEVVPLRSPAS